MGSGTWDRKGLPMSENQPGRAGGPPRRLVVFRHAKAAAPERVADRDRPLAERGRRDAAAAGVWLRDAAAPLDHVLCSTAERARETWALAAADLQDPPAAVHDERVYDADVDALLDVLRETPVAAATAVLVGHNPGMQHLVLALAANPGDDVVTRVREDFPTCALAVLTVPRRWDQLTSGCATVTELGTPRG